MKSKYPNLDLNKILIWNYPVLWICFLCDYFIMYGEINKYGTPMFEIYVVELKLLEYKK